MNLPLSLLLRQVSQCDNRLFLFMYSLFVVHSFEKDLLLILFPYPSRFVIELRNEKIFDLPIALSYLL